MAQASSSLWLVDEKFLDVESRSLMLVNWQKGTSPSQFLCNPTFGGIYTTKTSNYGWRKQFFGIFGLAKMGVVGLILLV